jgi:hypothetical protein
MGKTGLGKQQARSRFQHVALHASQQPLALRQQHVRCGLQRRPPRHCLKRER